MSTTGTSSDDLVETYDGAGRLLSIGRGTTQANAVPIAVFAYNPDGTAATRTDYDPRSSGNAHASSFTYTNLGQLATASLPDSMGTAAYTWQLDGSMATRTWGTGTMIGEYAYDGAKRPTSLSIKVGGSTTGTIGRTYDLAGNAASETQP